MHIRPSLLLPCLLASVTASAQGSRADSLPAVRTLHTHEVTDQSLRKTDDLIGIGRQTAPTLVISRQSIQLAGSRRLDEVLREQTGMAIVPDLGSGNRSVGIQLQGFSSEYVLILIDGQPMTGRLAGNFDLSRIGVADVERIEVIKGAASSLYGSEALGGVINIITRQVVRQTSATAGIRHGTYQTTDANINAETPFRNNKGFVSVSGNFYKTDGFNANTEYLKEGKTSPPYHSGMMQARAHWRISDRTTLQARLRAAGRSSEMFRNYGAQPFSDHLREQDINAGLGLRHLATRTLTLQARYYYTGYDTRQTVTLQENGRLLQENDFFQQIHRLEVQAEQRPEQLPLVFLGGIGGDRQSYRNPGSDIRRSMNGYFGYLQTEYSATDKFKLTAGLRYDGNSDYGGRLNLSAGALYRPVQWLGIRASMGNGFKPPTYAQMYQVFTNITQGYTVIGAHNFAEKAAQLKAAGTVAQIWDNASQVNTLQPETSTSFNTGITLNTGSRMEWQAGAFMHRLRNLINTEQVGIMRNGQQLFSYINIDRVTLRGVEAGWKYSITSNLQISAGYQLLEARNPTILDSIRQKSPRYKTVRTPDGIRPATSGDYFGLPNRSRHMASLQTTWAHPRWGLSASFRGTYRGKYGFLDVDNNGYIDPYDVFVKGHVLLYASVQKTLLQKRLTLHLGVDNLTGHTDYLMPSQPGRMFMAGAEWHFLRKISKH
ncbi:TonB-dependent receptor plug domain-containing protein [Chitinophaga deserti]|uniref:TonB-dependent receptor plug domain-containing protein n=1 Tax=Chitinophaga deserti TaxID=2164099 RepID=UPI000D6C4610|nr:TonB-dependent receptor [Chitinophaga deserti]